MKAHATLQARDYPILLWLCLPWHYLMELDSLPLLAGEG